MTQVQKQTEIKSAVVYRVRSKATHQVMYLVQSDTQEHTFYEVRWNPSSLLWKCNCPSRHGCKHQRAVCEILRLRRIRIAAEIGEPMPAIVARMQEDSDRRQHAPLNGGGRAFSLLK